MTITIGAGGQNRTVTEVHLGTSTGRKTVLEAWIGTPAGNRLIYASAPPLTCSISPSGDSWQLVYWPDNYQSNDFYCSVSGGTEPYSYAWNCTANNASAAYPDAPMTRFEGVSPGSGIITCTVTDANDQQVTSNEATIY